jgi:hypothetical protein
MTSTELSTRKFEELVANALEHLWDYAYLGKHPLAELQSLKKQMHSNGKWSHVDMGRTLNETLRYAIERVVPVNHWLRFSISVASAISSQGGQSVTS